MEKKMKKLLSLTFTALLAVLTLPLSAFDIVVNKEAKAVIIQGNRSMLCDMAVKNFHTAILKCTGVNLKILPAKDINKVPTNLNRIIIGDCKYAASKGFIGKNLRLEEYQLKVLGKDLFITGHDRIAPEVTPRGGPQPKHDTMDFRQYSPAVLWAVNELLDFQMKVRFLWPGELGTYYPKMKDVRLPNNYERKNRPYFAVRHLWFKGKAYRPEYVFDQTNTYVMNHQQGMRIETKFVHDTYIKWWNLHHEKNPDVLALAPDGSRKVWALKNHVKLCLSNPKTFQFALDQWRKAGRPSQWSFCPNDGLGFCTCKNCRQLDDAKTRNLPAQDIWLGKVSLSRRYITFWNKLISQMRKENPNITCFAFGYNAYKFCPPDMKLEPGIMIATVPPDFSMDGDGMKVWKGWEASGAKILLRPNWLNTYFFLPYFPLKAVAKFSNYSRKAGAGFEHDCMHGCWSMQGIYCYTLARLSYRPDLSVEDIKKEYASAFGAASKEILQWISYWEKFTDKVQGGVAEESGAEKEGLYAKVCRENKKIRSNALYGSWETVPYIYTPEVFAPAEAILAKAAAKVANNPEALARVKFLQDGQKHALKMYDCLKLWWKAPYGRTPEFIKAYTELLKMRVELSPRLVVSGDILNYNEYRRFIKMLPMKPNGSWFLRSPSVQEVIDFTDKYIKDHSR